MRNFLSLFSILCIFASIAQAQDRTLLHGEWRLAAMVYRGTEIPPLNPNLNLRWSFFLNGSERLYWDRKDEKGFCERFANYEIRNNQIYETVFAVNPMNSPECAQDPDMQLGRQTSNKIEIQKQQILLYLQIGDEELIYILKEVL